MSTFKTLGRYEIIKELGRGGMGIVLKGKDPKIDRLVALKIIRLDDIGDSAREQELLERFYIEARAAGKLTHPNIVTIYDVGEEEGKSFIAMEFVEGRDLSDVLEEEGALPMERATRLITQIADGLAFAHECGIVHRDVKPGNILLHGQDMVKITDFGLARLQSAGSVTQTGHAVGSPSYMSPEQVQGMPVDGRSDIFSLGVMYYEMLTGQRPFEGESLTSIIFKIVKEEPLPPSKLNKKLPPVIDKIVAKMTAKELADRYQSCREVEKDLKRLLSGKEGFFELTESDAARTIDFARGDVTLDLKDVAEAPVELVKKGSAAPLFAIIFIALLSAGGWYYYDQVWGKKISSPAANVTMTKKSDAPPARKVTTKEKITPEAPKKKVAEVPEKPKTVAKAEIKPAPVETPKAVSPTPVDVTLVIKSSVAGKAYVDGKAAGNAPGRINMALLPGEHDVEVRAKAYSPWKGKLSVKDGGLLKVEARPGLAPGAFRIATKPEAGEVWVDGKKVGIAPLTLAGLDTGRHKLRVVKNGYEDLNKSFTVHSDKPTEMSVRLVKDVYGSLAVESSPAGAVVSVDGRKLGAAPGSWRVEKGSRTLSLKLDGYKPYSRKVSVEAGKTLKLEAPLEIIGSGLVVVEALPWADVYFNGEKVGTTPPVLEREATEGALKVKLVNPNYSPFSGTYNVEAGERVEISHVFAESDAVVKNSGAGKLKIISPRGGGTVFIDGKAYGKTPIEIEGLPVGEHNLIVKRKDAQDYRRKVKIEDGVTSRIEIP